MVFFASLRMTGKERLRMIAFVKAICRAAHKKAGLKVKNTGTSALDYPL
jgi:hypothetical protein